MAHDFTPIKATARNHRRDEEVRTLDQDDQEAITALLMGRKVVKVNDDHLLLDNGVVVKAIGRDGGCGCSAGCYDLAVLNGVDNIITRVEFDYQPGGDGYADQRYEGFYRIFVYAENQQINLMQFDGSDGNGYYGTGYEILVREVASSSSPTP